VIEEPLPQRVEKVILSQKKRIMGRKKSYIYVSRVADEIGPLVERALEQPSIQGDLRILAEELGLTLPAYKEYFRRKQEADLLLESGGDPNARSVSNAIGIAQWLASTGRSAGLRVDAAASWRLSAKIDALQADVMALSAQPETFTRLAPPEFQQRFAKATPTKALTTETRRHGEGSDKNAAASGAPSTPEQPAPASSPFSAQTMNPEAPGDAGSTPPPPSPPADPAPETAAPLPPATENTAPPPASDAAPGAVPTPDNPSPAAGPAPSPSAEPPKSDVAPAPQPAPRAPQPAPAPLLWSRDQWVRHRTAQMRQLIAKRRLVDERYDPGKAIAVQTRYLVRLTRTYGSVDWALQAYHGGEGGVANTVARYLGGRRQQFASTGGAIRGVYASRGGAVSRNRPRMAYSDIYFGTTPRTHPAAFAYLFGRSDDHRYYWWKVLMAERTIALYRRDRQEFERQWKALRPGQRMEAVWYPKPETLAFRDVAALKRAYQEGDLVRIPGDLRARGVELGNVAPLDPENAYHYKGLRPAAMGALLQLASLYRAHGGNAPLRILSLTQTEAYAAQLAAKYPRRPPKEPVAPEDVPVDLHPTGLCFDLQRPAVAWDRKVLEYALGQLFDRGQIYWLIERERGPSRYHVCPAPAHADGFAKVLPGRRQKRKA
jgi:hypothetical protein